MSFWARAQRLGGPLQRSKLSWLQDPFLGGDGWRAASQPKTTTISPPPEGRTNGGDEGGVELVLGEAKEDARLADAAVANERQLEEVVCHRAQGRVQPARGPDGGTARGPGCRRPHG